jgi:hypothetical protein
MQSMDVAYKKLNGFFIYMYPYLQFVHLLSEKLRSLIGDIKSTDIENIKYKKKTLNKLLSVPTIEKKGA